MRDRLRQRRDSACPPPRVGFVHLLFGVGGRGKGQEGTPGGPDRLDPP